MHGYGWDMPMWGMGWMWLWWALVMVGVIALALWLAGTYRQAPPPGGPREGEDSAEEILRQRYARGEINREEFYKRLDDLHRHGGASAA